MLKVRYEIATLKMTGWCAFETHWDELIAAEGEDIVWLENYDGVLPLETDFYYLNEAKDTIIANPDYEPPEPPCPSFEPLNPTMSIAERVKHIEEFLKGCYP